MILRYCRKCGIRPVDGTTPDAVICDRCAMTALLADIAAGTQPLPCPRCGGPVEVPLEERMVCPACGWVEESTED